MKLKQTENNLSKIERLINPEPKKPEQGKYKIGSKSSTVFHFIKYGLSILQLHCINSVYR